MRTMYKKQKKDNQPKGSPAWMTTYGDMMTLLLCFFVLLYSFSVLDAAKFEQIMSSLQHSFLRDQGVLEMSEHPDTSEEEVELEVMEEPIDMFYQSYLAVKSYLAEAGLEDEIEVEYEERGIVLKMSDAVFFDSGKADLKPESKELLEHIAFVLEQLPNRILVEGHTDNVPINRTMFPSNWELSVVRATKVVRHLTEVKELPADRFVAMGYGEYNPVDTNETSEGRARNRRVNIVISAMDEE